MELRLRRILFLLMVFLATDVLARQHRSTAAKHKFRIEHPCPLTGQVRGKCPGFVIDHIKPLACGGADDPSNMQWQTTVEATAKDRWERKDCMNLSLKGRLDEETR